MWTALIIIYPFMLAWFLLIAIFARIFPRIGDQIRESARDPYERKFRDE